MLIIRVLNTGNYYLKDKAGALEIWKGRFAPMGEKILIILPGVVGMDCMHRAQMTVHRQSRPKKSLEIEMQTSILGFCT